MQVMTRILSHFTADLDLAWRYKSPPELLVVVRELSPCGI
jgi:hypothetical protein